MSNHSAMDSPGEKFAVARRTGSRSLLVSVIVVAALFLTGCTTSSGTNASTSASASSPASVSAASSASAASGSTAYPAGKEQVCAARDQLKASLSALTSPSALTGGVAGIKAAITKVQGDVKLLAVAGKQDFQPQLTALQSALTKVQTALSSAGSDTAATLKAALAGTRDVGVAAAGLLTQLKAGCGS